MKGTHPFIPLEPQQLTDKFVFEPLEVKPRELLIYSSHVSFNLSKLSEYIDSMGKLKPQGYDLIERLFKHKHKSPAFVPKIEGIISTSSIITPSMSKQDLAGVDWFKEGKSIYYTFSLYSALKLFRDPRVPSSLQKKLSKALEKDFSGIIPIWEKYNSPLNKLSIEEKALYQKASLSYHTFRVEMPILLANQIKRHIVGFNFCEVSYRYSAGEKKYFMTPEFLESGLLRDKPSSNRQGSGEGLVEESKIVTGSGEEIGFMDILAYQDTWYQVNNKTAAPEICRAILPQNTCTTLVVSMSEACAARLCSLRVHYRAQKEAQVFAEMVRNAFLHINPEFISLMDIAAKI